MAKPRDTSADSPRHGRSRSAGELIGAAGGPAFKRFGFVQGAVVSRWGEIVGERYARVSSPESIRFPTGSRKNGTLTLLVEGAHAPLMQHLGPLVIERVNRFFGYEAVAKLVYRQGRIPQPPQSPARPAAAPVPAELGEGLRAIADPELRACLESLAGQIAATTGPPLVDKANPEPIPSPKIRSIT
ncbi:MAG TPA: DUF721 domain-containing protein [Sphingomicrobium sp.]|nr:DUF721 domain-containing protein [Sphingomicrobium sp.]